MLSPDTKKLIREAYRQGYLNAWVDGKNNEIDTSEQNFDGWLSEVIAENFVGDLPIKAESEKGA